MSVRAPLGTSAVTINGTVATRAADGVSFTADVAVRSGDNPVAAIAYPFGQTATANLVGDFRAPRLLASLPEDRVTTANAELFLAGFFDEAATVVNAANLAARFIDGLDMLYGGTRLAEQELGGVLVDGEGSLWKLEEIACSRAERPAKLDRVVVAIDPPAGLDGSACGIVVAGRARGRDGKLHGYVLADRSAAGLRPLEWAEVAAHAAREFGAAKIVAESNQGGEMVRQTLLTAGAECRIELVHASKGKCVRAEPVSARCQQGRGQQCGVFSVLEGRVMGMGVGQNEAGLDRADALVWAITALKLTGNSAPLPIISHL